MAKIDDLAVSVYRIPLEEPESDGTFTWDSTTVVICNLSVDLGASEGPMGPVSGFGYSYATTASATLMRDVLRPVVLGADPMDVPAVWRAMVDSIRNIGRPGVASMAIAAVDIALWDLKAKLFDLPLCLLLGAYQSSVPIYGSGGFTSFTPQQLSTQLGDWVHEQSIPRVKMKIGTDWGASVARDLHRIELARSAIGDDAELFVDANGAYGVKQAIRLARQFAQLGVSWFEEPVSSDDLDGLHQIRGQIDCDVAAGEYGYDLAYFSHMCAAGAVDVLQADVSRCAGITEWLRVAALADAYGLEISGHCAPELHLHPACSVTNLRHLEYFADHVRIGSMIFDGVCVPQDGRLAPDLTRNGIGLSLRTSDAEPYRIP